MCAFGTARARLSALALLWLALLFDGAPSPLLLFVALQLTSVVALDLPSFKARQTCVMFLVAVVAVVHHVLSNPYIFVAVRAVVRLVRLLPVADGTESPEFVNGTRPTDERPTSASATSGFDSVKAAVANRALAVVRTGAVVASARCTTGVAGVVLGRG